MVLAMFAHTCDLEGVLYNCDSRKSISNRDLIQYAPFDLKAMQSGHNSRRSISNHDLIQNASFDNFTSPIYCPSYIQSLYDIFRSLSSIGSVLDQFWFGKKNILSL